MKRACQRFTLAGLLFAALSLALQNAEAAAVGGRLAYLDPGAGSFLLQALIAALAGIVVTLSVYWQKFKQLLGLGRDEDSDDDPDDD